MKSLVKVEIGLLEKTAGMGFPLLGKVALSLLSPSTITLRRLHVSRTILRTNIRAFRSTRRRHINKDQLCNYDTTTKSVTVPSIMASQKPIQMQAITT